MYLSAQLPNNHRVLCREGEILAGGLMESQTHQKRVAIRGDAAIL
jgi:hypothetical protein